MVLVELLVVLVVEMVQLVELMVEMVEQVVIMGKEVKVETLHQTHHHQLQYHTITVFHHLLHPIQV